MTNETAPERIWFNGGLIDIHMYTSLREFAGGTEYVRADAFKAAQARIAELEGALKGALDVIDDYLGYEHDGDPWTEDARQMGEMDINEYQRDGRLEAARAALGGKG